MNPHHSSTAWFILLTLVCLCAKVRAQTARFTVNVAVRDSLTKEPLIGSTIVWPALSTTGVTAPNGNYIFTDIPQGEHEIRISYLAKRTQSMRISVTRDTSITVYLEDAIAIMDEVTVIDEREDQGGITRLRQVEGFAIYAAKKNELIELDKLTINKAANRSRQIYAKVSGLNIWESDGAGVQLGIGGRGLSPSRNSNFNTRQNGYDISADALGYPESYYTPPVEAIDRIEIVRGAASLQYGTQFGGMLNFRFKEGTEQKKISVNSRQTVGSFGFFNSYNSLEGSAGSARYFGFYQYKKSDGWRINESLEQHTAYLSTSLRLGKNLTIRPEYTHTNYLAQQPGGLTDAQFSSDPRQSNRSRNWFAVDWNLFALSIDYHLTKRLRLNSRTFGLIAGRDALGNLDNINLLDFGENRDYLMDRFRNIGNETRILYQYNTAKIPSTFLVGVRYYRGKTLRKQGEGDRSDEPTFRYLHPDNLEGSDFTLPSRNFALFLENVFSINRAWTLTPGLRFEHIRTEANGYYRVINKDLAGNVILDERINESKVNPRSFVFAGLGVSYKPVQDLEIYANFSQNYRAINFNDIRVNVGSLVVDEELKDERGFNLDLGVRGRLGKLFDFDLTLYHLSYNDRIGTILKKEPNPVFNGLVDRIIRFRTNIADAKIYGLESLLEFNIKEWLTPEADAELAIFTNLSLTRARYRSSDISGQEGRHVELVPPFIFKTGLYGRWKDLGFNLQFGHTSEHFSDASNAVFTPSAIEGIIPSYQVADVSFKYLWKKMLFECSVNNLFDANYFTRRATGYPGPGIIPSQGRSFYFTLGYSL